MAIEDDVLVIGGGLAGITAALAAAEYDVRVRLISHKQSTLRHASGLIDVLGYTPDGEGPLVDPFDHLESLPSGHPYERVGADTVREALLFFDSIVGDAYSGEQTNRNALLPTAEGTVKPTARYPTTAASGLASDPRATLLVGFETLPSVDAPLAGAHLEASGVPFSVRGVTAQFPGINRDDAKVTRYARMLDRDEPVDTDGSAVPIRQRLAGIVRSQLDDERRVGLPALLGESHAAVVRRDLEERLGVDVFELAPDPPSLPGIRLENLLFDALDAADVRVTTGVPVVDYEVDPEGHITRAIVDKKGHQIPYAADQYVLATGGLVGKGIESSRTRVTEPVFDCHVAHSSDRYEWFADGAFGDHPFAQFGLAVDTALRPLDGRDRIEFPNLHAAGAVLGGYDFAAEKSGSGVSLATGFAAGSHAAAEVNS